MNDYTIGKIENLGMDIHDAAAALDDINEQDVGDLEETKAYTLGQIRELIASGDIPTAHMLTDAYAILCSTEHTCGYDD